MSTQSNELEPTLFWSALSEYRNWANERLIPSDDADCGIYAINEIAGLLMHTTSATIRARCSAFLSNVPQRHLERAEKLLDEAA